MPVRLPDQIKVLFEAAWGKPMSGEGSYAMQIGKTFDIFVAGYGLLNGQPPLSTATFAAAGQCANVFV